ncbi:MAG: sulfotransferase family protein [Alphaproteobacteria bacterium]
MALRVVGAGLGRTGTKTLKDVLERLGFGPCHHMFEVRENPAQLPFWQAAARGETPDWDAVFAGYAACVDWPAAFFWRELAAYYPDAKVLLSVRPDEAWLKSIQSTILPLLRDRAEIPPGHMRDTMDMAHRLIVERTFGGDIDDPQHVLAVYRAHADEVRRTIPSGRLLTYDVAEGWEPLCRFLGVPIPDAPFPVTNTTKEFQERVTGARQVARR